jgi:hypothetical protein
MTVVGGTERRPVGLQLLRGIGWFVALVAAVLGVLALAGTAHWLLGTSDAGWGVPAWRRISAVVLGVAVVGGAGFTWRRLRAWGDRPRWIVPAAAAVLAAALVPALWLPAPAGDFHSSACFPIADAWQPVVTASAADLAFFAAGMHNGLPSGVQDKASIAAYRTSLRERSQTPAYQRASRYTLWVAGGGSCTPRSRTALGSSAIGLGLGAAALSLAVRRRRS